LLLEEALEIAPDDEDVRRLAIDHGLLSDDQPTRPAGEGDNTDRQKQAARGIQTLVNEGKLVEAARALAFASRLFTDLQPASDLARAIVDRLRDAVVEVRHRALRQAHQMAVTLRRLEADNQLDPDLAEHLAERAEELAPGRTSVLKAAASARQRSPDGDRDARTAEAIASIEDLITARKADLAAQALAFAIHRYGSFEQAGPLAQRIDHARRTEQE
jgi:hypothetical protein